MCTAAMRLLEELLVGCSEAGSEAIVIDHEERKRENYSLPGQ